MTARKNTARAIADLGAGTILATVDIAAPPERIFRALTTEEVTKWWGSDEMYRTTEFAAELRVGGAWHAKGQGASGPPFIVQGEYLELDPPRKIVQTWRPDWDQGATSTLTYLLEPTAHGARVTVRHEGFGDRRESCENHSNGWELVLGWLESHLSPASPAAAKYFLCRLLPPRPSFAFDMSEAERRAMGEHVAYWTQKLEEGVAIVFGPVADASGPWGLGVVRVPDEAALKAMTENDPAIRSGLGLSYQTLPMLNAVHRQ
ncbi:MAG TPA: SRPBCC domain-containing protein [Polyangiaceae bacterium]|nr:SRPBCC domain-containing protein [Polyangiaceae bacterium]